MLVESVLTSSVKARESVLISRRYGVHGLSSSCFVEIGVPKGLRRVYQENSGVA